MSRTLLVLRHAKSDWNTPAGTDFDRPLAKRGRKDAPRMGHWIRHHGLCPDYIVSSPAERTKETVLAVIDALALQNRMVHWDRRVYLASLGDLLESLADCPAKAGIVLLVGHNPGMEELVRYLGGDQVVTPEDGKLMPTAALAELAMPDGPWTNLGAGCARLLRLARAKEIATGPGKG